MKLFQFNRGGANRSGFLLPLIYLSLSLTLSGCGGGGSGATATQSASIKSESLDVFPMNADYQWYYNNAATPVAFTRTLNIADHDIHALEHITGAREYFFTTAEELQYFGVYIPSVVVQTIQGSQTYTADIRLDTPITLFSHNWTQGHGESFSGNGQVNIQPTYGIKNVTYDGTISYIGTEDYGTPLGTYQAEHVIYSFVVSTNVNGLQIDIPFSTQLWLATGVGVVGRVESGLEFKLTATSGLPSTL